jgi:hypothetical protein
MSLIEIRRERKREGHAPRPPRLWKQVLTLALVLYIIWTLGQRF